MNSLNDYFGILSKIFLLYIKKKKKNYISFVTNQNSIVSIIKNSIIVNFFIIILRQWIHFTKKKVPLLQGNLILVRLPGNGYHGKVKLF